MQPNQDKNQWQQPTLQPSQAPYAPPQEDEREDKTIDQPLPQQAPLSPDNQLPFTDESQLTPLVDDLPDDVASEDFESEDESVHWQAQEYIHHEKNILWFIIFGVVIAGLMAIAIWLMQSITFAVLVPVMAVALIVYLRRPPRILNYTLSHQGLHINDRLYPFADFKGFGVIHDGKEYSVMLIPIKRFQPGVSVYFPEEAGEAIVDMLGVRLPMQPLHLDPIDLLIHKLRI